MPAFRPIERANALQPEIAAFIWIEVELPVRPSGSEAGTIVKCGIHLEVASIVLDLVGPGDSACVVAVGELRGHSVRAPNRTDFGVRLEESGRQLLRRRKPDGKITASDTVMTACVFRVREDRADIVRLPERICRPGDAEELVFPFDRPATISKIFRRLIRCVQ